MILQHRWARISFLAIMAAVGLTLGLYYTLFADDYDRIDLECDAYEKIYAYIDSGYGPVAAQPTGYNPNDGSFFFGRLAETFCFEDECGWLHVTSYPHQVRGVSRVSRWVADSAYAVEWVRFRWIFDGFGNSPYAWCSDSTPPHDVLEPIKDWNHDGSTLDDLERRLKERGAKPLPEHIKSKLRGK